MWTAIASIVSSCVSLFVKYVDFKNIKLRYKLSEQGEKERVRLRERIKEMEDKINVAVVNDIGSVQGLRMELEEHRKQLSKLLVFVVCIAVFCGCSNKTPAVIGEDVIRVNAGEKVNVPVLKNGVRQWYLINDRGMLTILGINKPYIKDDIPRKNVE